MPTKVAQAFLQDREDYGSISSPRENNHEEVILSEEDPYNKRKGSPDSSDNCYDGDNDDDGEAVRWCE